MEKKMSRAGVDFIKGFEGLELSAYPDPASPLGRECTKKGIKGRNYTKIPNWKLLDGDPWTIGYGHTGPDVLAGMTITEDQALGLKMKDLQRFEEFVNLAVKVEINQNQFDALVSFAYNCGNMNLKNSTLLKKLNAKDYIGAAGEFIKWNKADGQVMAGLTRRRLAERELFLKE